MKWRVGNAPGTGAQGWLPAAVTAALAIAACGSTGTTGGGGASTSAASAASASSTTAAPASASSTTAAQATAPASSSSSSSAAPAHTGAVTAPGTKLSSGQMATLLYTPPGATGGPAYTLQITVQSIKKGTLSDFNGVQLNAAEKAATPDYVKVHIKNVGSTALTGSSDYPAVPLEGVDNTGQSQQSVTFIGDFPPCPDNDAPKPFTPGQTFDTCLTFLVPGGITKVSWNGTDKYIDSPVTWGGG